MFAGAGYEELGQRLQVLQVNSYIVHYTPHNCVSYSRRGLNTIPHAMTSSVMALTTSQYLGLPLLTR